MLSEKGDLDRQGNYAIGGRKRGDHYASTCL
jgi:hypothetical protein